MGVQVNCSDIATTTSVALNAGTLGATFCHEDMQTTYNTMFTSATASFPGGAFVVGDGDPDSGDQNKLWLKQDGTTCEALGWYYYDSTWKAVRVPVTALNGASGVTAGTYGGVTVAATGIVTAGTSQTTVTTGDPTGGANGDFHYKYYA